MKASELLAEIGNASYPYTRTRPGQFRAELSDGRVLVVAMWQTGKTLELIFDIDGETEMTGGGDQFKIMSTVTQVLQNELPGVLNTRLPGGKWTDCVYFTAESAEASRVRYYVKRFAPTVSKILRAHDEDWYFELENDGAQHTFTWRR